MKTNKIISCGISAAVAMLIGANAYSTQTVIGTITVPRGPAGTGIQYQGAVDNCTGLAAISTSNLNQGDAYFNRADTLLYIFDGSTFPTCPDGGVPFQGPQGETGPQGPQGVAGVDACIPSFSSSHSDATRRTTVTYQCGTTNETFEIADGDNGTSACQPSFSTAYNSTSRVTTATYTCGDTTQTFDIADGNNGAGICDGVANSATAVKTYTKTYTAHTTTAAGYVTLTQTMCNDSTNATNYEDTCVPIVPSRTAQNICSNGTYMECVSQSDSTTYNICRAVTTENATTISAAIYTAQSAADNAQSTADNAQLTATTTANKVDNATTGLAATYTLASNAISKDATFSTSNGYIVLTDGNTTKNVVALADIKGDKGCDSFTVVQNTAQTTTEEVAYDVICVEND